MLTKLEKINMNITDIAKDIRGSLKKEFPACRFSVQVERFSLEQSLPRSGWG